MVKIAAMGSPKARLPTKGPKRDCSKYRSNVFPERALRIHSFPGIFNFRNAALQRNAFSIGENHTVELQFYPRRLVDHPDAHFPHRNHGTFDRRSQGKQHIAAFCHRSDEYARDFGSRVCRIRAYGLLKAYLQLCPRRDRIGKGERSGKHQRGETALYQGTNLMARPTRRERPAEDPSNRPRIAHPKERLPPAS